MLISTDITGYITNLPARGYKPTLAKFILIKFIFLYIAFFAFVAFPSSTFAQTKSIKSSKSTQSEVYRISRLARKADADSEHERALELWRVVFDLKPGDYSAYRGIQRALIGLERYDETLEFLETAYDTAQTGRSRLDPTMVIADRIGVLFLAERDEQADEEIASALHDYRGSDKIYIEIANVLFARRLDDRAVSVIRLGRRECDNHYLYARDLARYYEARLNWENAIREYLLYIDEQPNRLSYVTGAIGDMPVAGGADSISIAVITEQIEDAGDEFAITLRRLLASLHFKAKRYPEALTQYKLLDKFGKDPGRELLHFGSLLMSEGEFSLAREAYNELVASGLSDELTAHASLGAGRAALELNEIDSARAAFNAVLVVGNPPDALFEAYENLGLLELDHGGSPALAREYFDSALKAARKTGISHERLSRLLVASAISWAKEGNLERAERELKSIVMSIRGKSRAVSAAHLELALLAFRSGRAEDMRVHANSLLSSDPSSEYSNDALMLTALLTDLKDDPDAIFVLGRADLAEFMGKYPAAAALLDSLSNSGAPRAVEEALWRLSQLELKRDRIDSALTALNRIMELRHSSLRDDLVVFTAAEIYENRLGNVQMAAEYYERLLIEHPDSPLVDRARRKLKAILQEPSQESEI